MLQSLTMLLPVVVIHPFILFNPGIVPFIHSSLVKTGFLPFQLSIVLFYYFIVFYFHFFALKNNVAPSILVSVSWSTCTKKSP